MVITSPILRARLTSLCLGVGIGLPWLAGLAGIALSPLLIPVVAAGRDASHRWIRAWGYFLAGAAGLPGAAATFFGPDQTLAGTILWIGSAALLALPWIWVTTGWRTLIAITIGALPPLGIIGWLSPLTAAGLWFPGWGWGGLGLLAVTLWGLAERDLTRTTLLILTALMTNLTYTSPQPPDGWVGVNTHVGPQPREIQDQYRRFGLWSHQAQAQGVGARVLVLPETLAPDWWAGTRQQIARVVPPAQIWLMGISVKDDEGLWDAVTLVKQGAANPEPLFKAVLPVPLSMWKPWARDGYSAALWQPIQRIANLEVMAVICYDQLLVWPWLEALWQKPQVIIAPSNGWWAGRGSIPIIQSASSAAWGRLMGIPVIHSTNQ